MHSASNPFGNRYSLSLHTSHFAQVTAIEGTRLYFSLPIASTLQQNAKFVENVLVNQHLWIQWSRDRRTHLNLTNYSKLFTSVHCMRWYKKSYLSYRWGTITENFIRTTSPVFSIPFIPLSLLSSSFPYRPKGYLSTTLNQWIRWITSLPKVYIARQQAGVIST